MIRRLITLAAALLLAAPAAAQPAFEVGKRAPDLTLPDLQNGRARTLLEFRGQRVLLLVYASW